MKNDLFEKTADQFIKLERLGFKVESQFVVQSLNQIEFGFQEEVRGPNVSFQSTF